MGWEERGSVGGDFGVEEGGVRSERALRMDGVRLRGMFCEVYVCDLVDNV